MRNKWLLTLIIAILALPFFSSAVLAEEVVVYEDGNYEVPLVVKYKETVFSQFSETAKVKIEDGKQYIQFSYETEFIKDLIIPDGEVDSINKDIENQIHEIGFSYEGSLKDSVPFTIDMVYPAEHDMDAYLDMSGIPTIQVPEEVGEPEGNPAEETDQNEIEDKPGEEVTEPKEDESEEIELQKISDLEDGFYLIDTEYLYIDSEKPSAMGSYLDSPVFLSIKDGKGELTVTINKDETVTLLQVNGTNAIESKVEGNNRYETFTLSNLTSVYSAYVEYQAPFKDGVYEGDADFRIVLDEANISDSNASEKPGAHIEVDETEEPKEDSNKPSTPNPSTEKPVNEEKIDIPDSADKAYTINYVIKDETKDKVSAADQFFNKPAVLIEKDGEMYLQLTSTSPEYIDWLRTEFGEMKVIKVNEDGSAVYQVKLPKNFELSNVLLLDMKITVPGVYENEKHKARLFFDVDTMKEIDPVSVELGEPIDDSTLPKVSNADTKSKLDPNTPSKPELGEGEEDTSAAASNAGNGGGLNPKTGEETNILLYVLLLIGSAIPLAVKAKRHFA